MMANEPKLKNSPISSPAKNYAVVVLNRYPELAQKFIKSIRATHDPMPSIVVVRDRNDATYGDGVNVIDGREPFVFAANANIGIQYYADRDVFLCNDDIECFERDFFPTLYDISRAYPKCGLLSPLIKGGVGSGIQNYFQRDEVWKNLPNEVNVGGVVCFPCVLLKRKMIRRVGLLDENFTGYGLEDDDYCIRARMNGFWPMVTKQLYIKHGNGEAGLHRGDNYSLSFAREPRKDSPFEYFNSKYQQRIQRPTGNNPSV